MTLSDFNYRIKVADYGRCGSRSKPSALLESHLKSADFSLSQRSVQMLKPFYWLTVLLTDIIEMADPDKLRLFHLLGLVVEIVLSPSLTTTHIFLLTGSSCRTP